jgi:hypothetical protein
LLYSRVLLALLISGLVGSLLLYSLILLHPRALAIWPLIWTLLIPASFPAIHGIRALAGR